MTGSTQAQVKVRSLFTLGHSKAGGSHGAKLGALTKHVIGIIHSISGPLSLPSSTVDSTSNPFSNSTSSATDDSASQDTEPDASVSNDGASEGSTSEDNSNDCRANLNELD
jgi:hypothetical protein